MKSIWRLWLGLFKVAIGAVVVACLLGAALLAFVQTDYGQRKLTDLVSGLLDRGEDGFVRVGRIRGTVPVDISLDYVSLGDRAGEWLRVEDLSISLSLRSLLKGVIRLPRVSAEQLRMQRTPKGSSKQRTEPVRLPHVVVEQFAVSTVDLAKPVVRLPLSFAAEGSVALGQAPGLIEAQVRASQLFEGAVDVGVRFETGATGKHLSVSVESETVRPFDPPLSDLTGRLRMDLLPSGLRGSVETQGAVGDRPVEVTLDFAYDGKTLQASRFSLVSGETGLSGDAAYTLQGRLLSGSLDARVGDLSEWANLLGEEATGLVHWKGEFEHHEGMQSLELSLESEDVVTGYGRAEQVSLGLGVGDLYGERKTNFRSTIQNGWWRDVRFNRMVLMADGPLGELHTRVETEGHACSAFEVDAVGTISIDAHRRRLVLTTLGARYAGVPLVLETPARITQQDAIIRFEPAVITVADAALEWSAVYGPDEIDARVYLSGLPTWSLPVDAFSATDGRIHAALLAAGTPEEPEVLLSAEMEELVFADPGLDELPPIDVTARVTSRDGTLRGAAKVDGEGFGGGTAGVELALNFSLVPFVFAVNPTGDVHATLDAAIDLSVLSRFPALSDEDLKGELAAGLAYDGSLQDGRVSGRCAVRDGAYESYLLGTIIRDVEIELVGDDRRLVLKSAHATDGEGGALEAGGSIDFSAEKGFPFRFDLSLQGTTLVRRDDLVATMSGRFGVEGKGRSARIDGDLRIDSAHLNLDNLPPARPPGLNLSPSSTSTAPMGPAGEEAGSSPMTVGGVLRVEIPSQFRVTSSELDSLWFGDLEVKSVREGWVLVGELQPRRGTFTFLSRRFRLREGTVRFDGRRPPLPHIDLTAEYERREFLAFLNVEGRFPTTNLRLTSIPALPSDEILTQILFGRDVGSITPLQSLQLAQAALSLRTGKASEGILGRLRSDLQLDQLELHEAGEAGASEATLVLGKRVSDRLYLEVNRSLSPSSGRLLAEFEIHPNFTLETDVGHTMRPGIGVNWKLDY